MAEQLSPAAQAVLDAYRSSHLSINNLAAAIEALADQVVPELEEPDWGAIDHIPADIAVFSYHRQKRSRVLAIAAALRGQDQPISEEL